LTCALNHATAAKVEIDDWTKWERPRQLAATSAAGLTNEALALALNKPTHVSDTAIFKADTEDGLNCFSNAQLPQGYVVCTSWKLPGLRDGFCRRKLLSEVNECGEIGEPSVILSSYLRDIYIHGLNRQKYGGLIGPNGSLAGPNGSLAGSNQSDTI
jgi:hypothetical protein